MTNKFGPAYTRVPLKERGPGSMFMDSFESCKKRFGGDQGDSYEIYPIKMVTNVDGYDEDEGIVMLSQ